MLEVEPDEIVFEHGDFKAQGTSDRVLNVREVIRNLRRTGGPFEATGVSGGLKMAPGFGASLVDLAVDPETGKVTILRWTQFQDVGKAIHPSYVEGQLQGGAVQGIGWGLYEEYVFREGHMQNPSFLDYRMPTALDLPMIDTVHHRGACFRRPIRSAGRGRGLRSFRRRRRSPTRSTGRRVYA